MSQLTAVDLTTAPARRPARPALSVVPSRYIARQFWFVLLLGITLIVGLLATLMINTALAKGTYVRGALVGESNVLADRQESLTHELDQLRAPASLAKKALKQGMVPAQSAAFISIGKGKVLGVAKPATPDKSFTVITDPTLKAKKGDGSASTSSASTPDATDKKD